MASTGFPGRDVGFGVQAPETGSVGLMKRPLSDMERAQQQQMQQALFLRSVKQRTLLASSASPCLSMPPPQDPFLGSSASTASLNLMSSGSFRRQEAPFSAPRAEIGPSAALRDGLQELERRLLMEDEEDVVSASGSAVTTAEWSEAMQQLITPPVPSSVPSVSGANQFSTSPTNSSSSTMSSSASSSPPSSLASAIPAGTFLRQMLLDTANAVADGNIDMATANLAVLKSAANYRGNPEQRLTAMMISVLFARLKPAPAAGSFLPAAEVCSSDYFAASQMLYEVSHAGQYSALFDALVDRQRLHPAARPPSLRITAVSDRTSLFANNDIDGALRSVGDRIENLAKRHGLVVRFDVVHRAAAAELDAAALGCEAGEALAVNLPFALARVPDESVSPFNPRDDLLRRVRALRPRVVALVEQEINTNTAAFAGRFASACAHYGVLLESLDVTAARDSADRTRLEAGLARRAVNSVAREGADRIERCEVFGKWRARMGMAGFKPAQLGSAVVEPVKARLESLRPNPGFSVAGEENRIGFAWKGRILTVASTWR
ncbi:scarecrow-like protein 8 isoform X2 [Zingiber officinale]|uniref:scarecrow-like protein 8 isoform X2 n=1 Tax=Zingiber officinale TaxID=94328 RepID=UPI001C4D3667|nr:scarecrow-like protein 8 isoform X2 [Zingiber officinale]